MEMGAREPPRDEGKVEARTADGDGGGERERLQVRAVLYLWGLEGSLGGLRQLLPPEWAKDGTGLGGEGNGRKAALLLKVVSKGGILPS